MCLCLVHDVRIIKFPEKKTKYFLFSFYELTAYYYYTDLSFAAAATTTTTMSAYRIVFGIWKNQKNQNNECHDNIDSID